MRRPFREREGTAGIRTAVNLAPLGVIVARVLTPTGGGTWDPNVIRDGVRPEVTVGENVGDSLLQFDTWDGANVADEDWIGYRFGCSYSLSQVVFQEGKHFLDGGYFAPPESLTVQLYDRTDDSWIDAPGTWTSLYQGQMTDGEIRNFETFVWNIRPPQGADGVRIHGTPGGSAAFISVAELEVYAAGVAGVAPHAVAAADSVIGAAPLAVNFDGQGSTAPASSTYTWDFGDGGSASGLTATHTYTVAATYTATLTITTPGKLCASDSLDITVHPTEFTTASGFVRRWLLLGPYAQAGGANPLPETMERDYLTDGDAVTESTILPREGMEVATSYGVAQSTGLLATSRPDINPGGVPTWFAWGDDDDTVNFQEAFQTIPVENMMVYACVYVTNVGAQPLVCDIGCASDDSIHVLLGDASVHTNSIARPFGNPGEVQDIVSNVTLPPARQVRLLVKVFQGAGDAGFRLRFQAIDGTPVAEPSVTFSLEPDETPPPKVNVYTGNANGDNTVNIADAVTILGYLFGKPPKPAIPCFKAADTNDDDTLNVADAIDVLTFLFGAQTNPSKPMTGPNGSAINAAACRPYPAADIPQKIIGQPGCATPCAP